MKKYFVDTNIVLRYLLDDPEASKIERILKSKDTLVVPDIVIAEIVWTLGRFYKWSKIQIVEFLTVFLKRKNLEFNENLIFTSLRIFLKHNIKYTDAYIGALMDQSKVNYIYSFDREFDRIEGINRLEPK